MSESSSLTILRYVQQEKKNKIFVSTSFCVEQKTKSFLCVTLGRVGGVKVKIPAIIANDMSVHGPNISLSEKRLTGSRRKEG